MILFKSSSSNLSKLIMINSQTVIRGSLYPFQSTNHKLSVTYSKLDKIPLKRLFHRSHRFQVSLLLNSPLHKEKPPHQSLCPESNRHHWSPEKPEKNSKVWKENDCGWKA